MNQYQDRSLNCQSAFVLIKEISSFVLISEGKNIYPERHSNQKSKLISSGKHAFAFQRGWAEFCRNLNRTMKRNVKFALKNCYMSGFNWIMTSNLSISTAELPTGAPCFIDFYGMKFFFRRLKELKPLFSQLRINAWCNSKNLVR